MADPVVPIPLGDEENVRGGVGTLVLVALLAAEGEESPFTEWTEASLRLGESSPQRMAGLPAPDAPRSPAGLLNDVCSIRSLARLELLSEAGLLMPMPGPLDPSPSGDGEPLLGFGIAPLPAEGVAPKPDGAIAPLLVDGIAPVPADGITPFIPEPIVPLDVPIEPVPCPAAVAGDWLLRLLSEPPAGWLLGFLFQPVAARFASPMLLSARPLPYVDCL